MPAAGKFLALTFLVSMMPSVSALQLDCGPGAEAEEKTQHTLTCEGLQADGTVYWTKYDRNLGKITVATCDATGFCQTNFSARYDVKRPNNVTSTLKILDVIRDDTFVEGEWSCVSRSNETASCYVTVVFLPHVGECKVGFSEQSGQVTGRCEMHKVYPSPTCNWYERLEGQETDIPSNQTTLSLSQYVDSSSSQVYFQGVCMLHRPLPVTAGSYRYKVLIIPGLVEPRVDFNTTDRVAVPAPPVLRNCPQDYVADADASSCTCATSDLGSPQGSLAWYDPNNNIVLRNTSLILALSFSRVTAEYSGQTYRCGVVHHTGSPSVDYIPKIAAPPNKPKLSGFDKNKVYEVGTTLSLQCSADGGRPAITRVILQCADRPDEEDIDDGGRVISRLSLTLQDSHKSGECVCNATNGFLTSERVTLPISDILTSDSGKGDKLELWQVIVIAVAGVLVLVIIAVAVVVSVKICKSRIKGGEHDPLTGAGASDTPDTSSDGEPAAFFTPTEKEECGASENSRACAVTRTNDCSQGVSSGTSGVREGNHTSKASGVKTIFELAKETNLTLENVYQTFPANLKENVYSTLDAASGGEADNQTNAKGDSSSTDIAQEETLAGKPQSTRIQEQQDLPQIHVNNSSSLPREHATPQLTTSDSDLDGGLQVITVTKSDDVHTLAAQGGQTPKSLSQEQAGQQIPRGVTASLVEYSIIELSEPVIDQFGEERGKQIEIIDCVSAEPDPSLQSNPLDNADSSPPHETGSSDGKQRDLRSSADSPDQNKDEDNGTEGHKTASDDSLEGERQPVRTETKRNSPTAISGAHDKIDQRDSSSPAVHHAESSADNEPGRRVKEQQPQNGDAEDTIHEGTNRTASQRQHKPSEPDAKYKTLIQIGTDNKPKEESLASSAISTVKHPQADSSEETSAGMTQPEQSNQGPSPRNKDGASPEVQHDDSDYNTRF